MRHFRASIAGPQVHTRLNTAELKSRVEDAMQKARRLTAEGNQGMVRQSRLLALCFFLLLSPSGEPARERKTGGEVFDGAALGQIRTACVDTSYLDKAEASAVKRFMAAESRPGRLLERLNWKFTDQCSAADGVIRVYFAQSERSTEERGDEMAEGVPSLSYSEPALRPVLLIYDRASIRLLYRTEGQHQGTNPGALLNSPFATLAKYLRLVGH